MTAASTRIAGDGTVMLMFAPVIEADEGLYHVTYFSAGHGMVESRPFLLEVQPAGSIPAAGGLGLAFLAVGCGLGGVIATQNLGAKKWKKLHIKRGLNRGQV